MELKKARTMSCRIISGPEADLGFRHAGVRVSAVAGGAEAGEKIDAILREGECGLLLISEDLHGQLDDAVLARLEKAGLPLVVPLPLEMRWKREERGMEYLLQLISRSIGYHMRIRK